MANLTMNCFRLSSGRRRVRSFSLALSFLLAAAIPVRADLTAPEAASEDALKHLSLEELSQIEVITPSKEPVKAFRSPVAIYVITNEQIRRSGATSIPEALRLAPGVEVARIDANKWSIGIRGFGSRFSRGVLVLIDGRTVYTTLLSGTYWEVQDTLMDDIDRIEVIRGPGGTIWGPNAVNGVINIITRNSKDTQGILASAGGGNEEQGFANLRYGGGNGKGFSYRAYGKAFTRAPEEHADSRSFDDWRAAQGGFRMDWQKDPNSSLTVQGDIYAEEAGESVQAVTYTAPYSQTVDANAQLSGGNFMARWKKMLSDTDDLQIQAYYDKTNRGEPNFGEVRNTFDVDFLQRLRLPGRNVISWGAGARFSRADDIQIVSGLSFLPYKRTDQLFTGFFQDEIGLVDKRVSLILGTKLLHTNFTGLGVEPSARLVWTPDDKNAFWTAYTHALRTPSDAEENFYLSGYIGTAADGTPFFARFNGNTHFAPEQLNGYEAGYRRLIRPNLYLDFAGFYNNHHDLFDEEIIGAAFLEQAPAPEHILLPAQFGNGLLGTTKGFEIAPEWRIASFWQLSASYSFLQMDIQPAPHSLDVGTAPGINGSSPKHEVTIHTAVDLSKKFSLDLDWRYVSALAGELVPAYSTADGRFSLRLDRQLEFSLVGQNLLQPSHAEAGGDPGLLVGIRRSAYAELRWAR